MKFFISGLLALLFSCVSAHAQIVGTIGVGHIVFKADNPSGNLISRSGDDVVGAVDAGVLETLVKTRKFRVLDLPQLQSRLTQHGLDLNKYYDKSYEGSEYLQAGLDYILTADITQSGVFSKEHGGSERNVGMVEMTFRLLGVADSTSDFESSVSSEVVADADSSASQVLDQTINEAVNAMINQIVVNLFPLRVMQLEPNGVVTLNYGQGFLNSGDVIHVFARGEGVAVNAKGEAKGQPVATLKVVAADTKFATANAVDGFDNLEKGQKGLVVSNAN